MEYNAASEEEVRDRAVESIGLLAQAWSIYGPESRPISESDIARESDRLRR